MGLLADTIPDNGSPSNIRTRMKSLKKVDFIILNTLKFIPSVFTFCNLKSHGQSKMYGILPLLSFKSDFHSTSAILIAARPPWGRALICQMDVDFFVEKSCKMIENDQKVGSFLMILPG